MPKYVAYIEKLSDIVISSLALYKMRECPSASLVVVVRFVCFSCSNTLKTLKNALKTTCFKIYVILTAIQIHPGFRSSDATSENSKRTLTC